MLLQEGGPDDPSSEERPGREPGIAGKSSCKGFKGSMGSRIRESPRGPMQMVLDYFWLF